MHKLTWMLVLMAGCCGSCATTRNDGGVQWPVATDCLADAAAGALSAVQSVLLDEGGAETIGQVAVNALERLALTYGPQTVVCLVDEATRSFHAPPAPAEPAAPPAMAMRSLRLPVSDAGTAPAAAAPPAVDTRAAELRGRDFLARVAHTRILERP